MLNITEENDSVLFDVRVIPRSSRSEIVGEYAEALKIKIAAPPVDGAANKELIKILGKELGVTKSSVRIIGGETSKNKRIKIEGVGRKAILELINS